jgi:hypothetical protein
MPVLPLHLGGLHPYEQLLVYLLAFGPFVVLAVVVYVVRRRDSDHPDAQAGVEAGVEAGVDASSLQHDRPTTGG